MIFNELQIILIIFLIHLEESLYWSLKLHIPSFRLSVRPSTLFFRPYKCNFNYHCELSSKWILADHLCCCLFLLFICVSTPLSSVKLFCVFLVPLLEKLFLVLFYQLSLLKQSQLWERLCFSLWLFVSVCQCLSLSFSYSNANAKYLSFLLTDLSETFSESPCNKLRLIGPKIYSSEKFSN